LVAKGYAQIYGIDYEETYSLVAKMTTIKAIITMATTKRWYLHQMDVKKCFTSWKFARRNVQPLGNVTKHILIWFVG
jgi:hypothetical protein